MSIFTTNVKPLKIIYLKCYKRCCIGEAYPIQNDLMWKDAN